MKSKVCSMVLSAEIEYHWFWIMRYRKRGSRMIHEGIALSAPELIALNNRLTKHAVKVMKLESEYERTLCEVAQAGQKQEAQVG